MFVDVATLESDPLAGTRYRAVHLLGTGSSSDVYEATGPKGERFAVKVLRPGCRDWGEFTVRLLQEGRVLASIQHPHVIPVCESGLTGQSRPFLAMPKIQGETLRAYLRRQGPLQPNEAANLAAGVLDGLHEAHCRGIVHRDVKPDNIFLAHDRHGNIDRAMIFDFGIAKLSQSPAYQTSGSRILGTPRYISPEQILGGRIDGRADVYAMAIVLFEAIAARGPYDVLRGAEFGVHMRAHLGLAPRKLDDLSPASVALARVVARALEKPPARRYPTAAAFAAALRRVSSGSVRKESSNACWGGAS